MVVIADEIYALGLGMRRRADPTELRAALEWGLDRSQGRLREVITLHRKAEQPSGRALIRLARELDLRPVFVRESELPGATPSRSRAEKLLGLPGSACEGVLLARGYEIVEGKRRFGRTVTAALGRRG